MSKKILHVLYNDKFIVPFIDFINENNLDENHTFLYFGGAPEKDFPIPDEINIDILKIEDSKFKKIKYFLKYFYTADKIILHSLFNPLLVKFLYLQPWLLKKCYWVLWGGDLYYHILSRDTRDYKLYEKWRTKVIRNLKGVICYNQAEYNLVKEWYGTKAEFFQSFFYPSNLFEKLDVTVLKTSTIYIQVGNSADPTNHHIEIFKKLKLYKNENIKIIVPLSYGNQENAKKVIKIGKEMFGDKLEPLIDFIPFDEYLIILGKIDIAIFNHNRQQAMGNITTLLGLGKKVYMRNTITPWELFKEINIKIFDVEQVDLSLLDSEIKNHNMEKVKDYFSKKHLVEQWERILGEEQKSW